MNTSTLVMLATARRSCRLLQGPPPQSADPGRLTHQHHRWASARVSLGGRPLKSENTNVCIHSGENTMNTMNLVMLASLAALTVLYMARRRNRLKNVRTSRTAAECPAAASSSAAWCG